MLLDCSLCHNRGCFLQEYVSRYPGSNKVKSMNFLPNHESLSEDLNKFMLKNILADISLKCGENVIPVHKTILAARSEVFLKKIQKELNVNSNVIIDVSDIEPFMLGVLLKYLYTGTIPDALSEENMHKLYTVSNAYAVPSLLKMCKCYISKNLNEGNFIDFLMLANAHDDKELTNAISNFVILNPVLMKNEKWIRFTKDFPKIAHEIHNKYITKALKR